MEPLNPPPPRFDIESTNPVTEVVAATVDAEDDVWIKTPVVALQFPEIDTRGAPPE